MSFNFVLTFTSYHHSVSFYIILCLCNHPSMIFDVCSMGYYNIMLRIKFYSILFYLILFHFILFQFISFYVILCYFIGYVIVRQELL